MKNYVIVVTMMIIIGLTGCSKGIAVSQDEYDKLKTELDAAKSKNKELETEIAKLKENGSLPDAENESQEDEITPIETELTSKELNAKLNEQPMFVVSTDYVIQDTQYKSLYPDLLNAIIKNASGKEIKNAEVAFVAWDKNNLPVKIKGQFDFNDGSYIAEMNCGDVNMIDGDTFGEDVGLALNESCDNIKTIKAIVIKYTDFEDNTWDNPYYDVWKSAYENKKLVE